MTPEATPVRKALSAAILVIALFAAVVIQLTVVNRLPLPSVGQGSGAVPDLVLLLVTAIAVATTPALAAITGFAGGLALDVAPPAAHYAGEYALVFCLVCYAASRVYRRATLVTGTRDPVTAFAVMAVAVAAGEAGKAALGMLLSDPDVTVAAVSRVLPGAVLYDLLLSPFAFLLVASVTRGRKPRNYEAGEPRRIASVFRQASAGAVPRLRLAGTGAAHGTQPPARPLPRPRFAGTGRDYKAKSVAGRVPKLRLSGTGRAYKAKPAAGRVPKLRLSDARSGSLTRTAAALSGTPRSPLQAGRPRRLNFGGGLPVRTASAVRTGNTRNTPAAEALAARSAPSGLSALAGTGTPLAAGRSPQPGWLGGSRNASTPAVRKAPRSGWLGNTRGRPRTVIGSAVGDRTGTGAAAGIRRGAFRRRRPVASTVVGSAVTRGNWYTASPSTAWLRRSRNSRKRGMRRRRLLRMMGVAR